jgi:hypothetical protein
MSGKPKQKQSANWGGKRAGSGQKKKPTAPPLTIEIDVSDVDLARATLRHIAMCGVTEGARVAAARDLWDRAEGKPGPAVPLSKDDEAAKPADKWGTILDEARPN